jgi:hypothetical protein
MDLNYLINVLQNKINVLTNAKTQAFSIGDLNQISIIEKELLETQNTLSQLILLNQITTASATLNSTPDQIIANGVQSLRNSVQGPSSSAIINGYDVSAYATDPQYEQKIWTIIENIPLFNVVGDIDDYIQDSASGSPVTGDMIYRAVTQYNVDLPLLIAIIQNDSSFGTAGVGARTFNPGNVGNTGYAEQSYPSWYDGVCAVAEWLSRHRVEYTVTPTPVVANETSVTEAVLPPTTPVVFRISTDVAQPVLEQVIAPSDVSTGNPAVTESSSTPEIQNTPVLDLRNATTSSSRDTDQIIAPIDTIPSTDISATSTQAYKRSKSKKVV